MSFPSQATLDRDSSFNSPSLASLRISPASPASPTSHHAPLTPPLTPSSSLVDNINPSVASSYLPTQQDSIPPNGLTSSAHKPRLPKLTLPKINIRHANSDVPDPNCYDLSSPTDPPHRQDPYPGHFVMIQGIPKTIDHTTLPSKFQTCRGMTGIQTKHLQDSGTIVLAFDDSRDTHAAYIQLSRSDVAPKLFPESDKLAVSICDIQSYKARFGTSHTLEEVRSQFVVSTDLGALDEPTQCIFGDDIQKYLERGGELRSFQRIPPPSGSSTACSYLVDYYKASNTNTVCGALNGESVNFMNRSAKLVVEKIAVVPPSAVRENPGHLLSATDRSSSVESLPTLSRRHSTASFNTQRSATPTASPVQHTVNDPTRKLNHSISEVDLRKKPETRDGDGQVDGAAEEKSSSQEPAEDDRGPKSTLSPHAQPFRFQGGESRVPPLSGFAPSAHSEAESPLLVYPPASIHHQHHHSTTPQPPYPGTHYYAPHHYVRIPSLDEHHQHQRPEPFLHHSPTIEMAPVYYTPTRHTHHIVPSSTEQQAPLVPPQYIYANQLGHQVERSLASPGSPRDSYSLNSSMSSFTGSNSSHSHGIPPRNALDLEKIERGEDTRTTVMVKNIPNKMSDKDLIHYINAVCPRRIDFLYLRMDFTNHCNVGYAFVNFISVGDLLHFARSRLGTKWNMFSSEKVLQMSYANYQGKEALVEKFKNSCVMNEREEWRPKVFFSSGEFQGMPEPFPSPTHMKRMERSQQARGPLWGANGPPSVGLSPSSARPARFGLWTRLRMQQDDGRHGVAGFTARHFAA